MAKCKRFQDVSSDKDSSCDEDADYVPPKRAKFTNNGKLTSFDRTCFDLNNKLCNEDKRGYLSAKQNNYNGNLSDYDPNSSNSEAKMKSFNSNKNANQQQKTHDLNGKFIEERRPTRVPKCFNRNALMARENRLKKKMHMEYLEENLNKAQIENSKLRSIMGGQSTLIANLRKEVKYLKGVLNNSTEIVRLLNAINNSGVAIAEASKMSLNDRSLRRELGGKNAHPWQEASKLNLPYQGEIPQIQSLGIQNNGKHARIGAQFQNNSHRDETVLENSSRYGKQLPVEYPTFPTPNSPDSEENFHLDEVYASNSGKIYDDLFDGIDDTFCIPTITEDGDSFAKQAFSDLLRVEELGFNSPLLADIQTSAGEILSLDCDTKASDDSQELISPYAISSDFSELLEGDTDQTESISDAERVRSISDAERVRSISDVERVKSISNAHPFERISSSAKSISKGSLEEHNYTAKAESESSEDEFGVCLHVSKGKVSLEFCMSCSESAVNSRKNDNEPDDESD